MSQSPTLELTRELVARPSVTPDDGGCQQLIAERLLPLGFDVEWFLCGDVSNVLITRGRGEPSFWFMGHTDVVPPGPEDLWTFLPFNPGEKDGELHGRGVADMKGGVAAMVVALETFAGENPGHDGEIGLMLTSDEEGAAIDGVIPTFDAIADGSYPVSRPLFFYVKDAHANVIPGIKEYVAEFTSDRAWGDEGYLSEKGLIPMPEEERTQVGKAVKDLTPLQL